MKYKNMLTNNIEEIGERMGGDSLLSAPLIIIIVAVRTQWGVWCVVWVLSCCVVAVGSSIFNSSVKFEKIKTCIWNICRNI